MQLKDTKSQANFVQTNRSVGRSAEKRPSFFGLLKILTFFIISTDEINIPTSDGNITQITNHRPHRKLQFNLHNHLRTIPNNFFYSFHIVRAGMGISREMKGNGELVKAFGEEKIGEKSITNRLLKLQVIQSSIVTVP